MLEELPKNLLEACTRGLNKAMPSTPPYSNTPEKKQTGGIMEEVFGLGEIESSPYGRPQSLLTNLASYF